MTEQVKVNGNGAADAYKDKGGRFMDSHFDPDDPDYIREMQRPADVSEDLQEMKRRERVTMVLKSQAFRDELEAIIQDAVKAGCNPTSLLALQQISELVLPQNRFNQSGGLSTDRGGGGGGSRGGSGSVIPVADIRGVDSLNYTKGEKLVRCKLASVYRLIDLQGWTHGIYNHITVRINVEIVRMFGRALSYASAAAFLTLLSRDHQAGRWNKVTNGKWETKCLYLCIKVRVSHEHDHFLLNPFGMLYHEITASSLVKVHLNGQIVDMGSTTLGINLAGYLLHSAIHGARPDIMCVIHFHTGPCAAVASMKCGLLPLCQEAAILGEISYHDYNGILVDETERDLIIRNLGPFNKVMVLRNHGVVACGSSIEEAFLNAFNLHAACEVQVRAMAAGLDNLIIMNEPIRKKTFGVGGKAAGGVDSSSSASDAPNKKKWRTGELEFEAWMRLLDNMGYRTGYIYRNPLIRTDQSSRPKANQDVELPPSCPSFATGLDDDGIGSLLKEYLERKKASEKVRWLNTPNAYQKVEILESGTSDPKKIIKWVPDASSPSPGGTPIKLNNLQFSPVGSDVREFKLKQQNMKERRNQGLISSGPESKVLEGVTWDEADGMPDALTSGSGDRLITVGAVSKGIIKRDQQHNVGAYKTTYQRNPFDSSTPEDIEQYLLEVERKKSSGEGEGEGDGEGYHVRMQSQSSSPHPHIAHSQSGPVIPPASQQPPRAQTMTPPPTHSDNRSTEVSSISFSRSKSDRFTKDRAGTYPFRKAPAGLNSDESERGMNGGHDNEDTGSEPNSPISDRGMKKSDTLDSGDLDSPGSKDKKKKKKGFRMPSFSLGRKKSKDATNETNL